MSQNQKIMKHLSSGKTLTPIDALIMFGCFRLGARILELRKMGHKIKTRMVEENGKRFAEYSIGGGNNGFFKNYG